MKSIIAFIMFMNIMKTGCIEVGKNADLSVIAGDVTKNDYLYNTELTLKRGEVYDAIAILKSLKDKVHSGY